MYLTDGATACRVHSRARLAEAARCLGLALCLAVIEPSEAACSRPIIVPASSLGMIMIADNNSGGVSGSFPDLLREQGKKFGCEFVFPIVPRARAELMVQSGSGDMLLGAVQVPARDAWGDFVPMLGTEWVLITSRIDAPPTSVDELVARTGIKFNAVRGFNGGPAYVAMLGRLHQLGELEYVSDTETIVRKMVLGRVDYTFMPSQTFAGTLEKMGLRKDFGANIRYVRLDGIPRSTNGVYLSQKMSASDGAQVRAVLDQIRKDGSLLRCLHSYFTRDEMVSLFPLPNK